MSVTRLESKYKKDLKRRIEHRLPGCIILKNDEQLLPGIPDMLILHGRRWAALEVKRDLREILNPGLNQPYYVNLMDEMSFAAFICPSNEKEVLDALQRSFETYG